MKSVFVSSVIRGFEEFRAAARQGIELMDCRPIMAEQFSARPYSSEVACTHEAQQSDVYLVIFGQRYGYETEDGLSITHAEYRAARDASRPILAFVQDCDMEPKQRAFKEEVEQYSQGVFRTTFTTAEQLKDEIVRSLRHHETMEQAVPEGEFQARVDGAITNLLGFHDDAPSLVLAFLPQPGRLANISSIEQRIDEVFATSCSAGLARLRDGFEMLDNSSYTGFRSGKSRLVFWADGLIVLLVNPTLETDSLFSGMFAPPDRLEAISIGFQQLISDAAGFAHIELRNMSNTYVAPLPSGSSLTMRMSSSDDPVRFTRLFTPLTVGAYEEWVRHCIAQFERAFRYGRA